MKSLIKKTYTFLIIFIWKIKNVKTTVKTSVLFLSKFSIEKSNDLQFIGATLEKSSVQVQGINNQLLLCGDIYHTDIKVYGSNNQIVINCNVKFNKSSIVLRGNNCKIEIGEGTAFGSVYMVCMGQYNFINIGRDCMFADKIDLWATDTHPIYNDRNELINPSKSITVGDHVWVGAKTSILKGVDIGEGAVIGMSSMVTKDVEPFTLNVGNPLRCLKTNINWKREFIEY